MATVITVVAIILLLSMLLRFKAVADVVAPVVGTDPDTLMANADKAFDLSLGILLILLGVFVLTGWAMVASLIVVGVIVVGMFAWKTFLKKKGDMDGDNIRTV